jgi:hypothetical protein
MCTAHKILFRRSSQEEYDRQGMWHVWETALVHTEFLLQNLNERGNLEDLGIERRIILKLKFEKVAREAWTGLIWLRIATGGGLS